MFISSKDSITVSQAIDGNNNYEENPNYQKLINEKNKTIQELKRKLTTLEDQIKNNNDNDNDNDFKFMDSINLNNMNINNYNEEIIKEKDKKINDLNKTIESLTKENQQLKLKLLKVNNFQNEIDELNKIIEEEKIKYSDLNNLYLEEIHKNEMLNIEMKINEKEVLRQNRATLRESGMMDIQKSN
jgi:chromosome segregation ATPase